MSYIIDRRLNGKNKSMVNRQRFLRRYKQHIKGAVSDAVNKRSALPTWSVANRYLFPPAVHTSP